MPPKPPETIDISPEDRGARLDAFLAGRLGTSRSQVRKLLARGAVTIDGVIQGPAHKGAPLPGEGRVRVCGFVPPGDQRALPESDTSLRNLASGPGWLALDKPAGMPVHPLEEGETGTVLNAVAARHPEVHGVGERGLRSGVVHRLDVDTSGVLLVAIREDAWQRLRTAFAEHRVVKVYRAVVLGCFDRAVSMRVGLRVAQHRPARVRVLEADAHAAARDLDVRIASLAARPLEPLRGATLVEIRPQTGFLHQIRAVLAHLGHPVAGDATYGNSDDPGGAERHLLHAARIAVDEIDVASPDPEDFRRCLDRLRR